MIVPVQLPPGAYRNGTEYQSRGRWRDVNWVRWDNGVMQPMGVLAPHNTSTLTSVEDEVEVRAALGWKDNSGNDWVIYGNRSKCLVWDGTTGYTDISPSLTAAGATDREGTWQFRMFGELPLACHRKTGTLWEWDLNTANNLTQITNSPTSCRGIHVTPERFVWALGDGGDPRSIRWSDRDDRTVWTAAATNQAGGFDLDTEGEIEFAMNLRGVTIIVTTTDVWRATYVGYPDVYTFDRLGPCKVVGPNAGAVHSDALYWMGHNNFYRCDGNTVEVIESEVGDYVFQRLLRYDTQPTNDRTFKVWAWTNENWGEVWWHYPKIGNDEPSAFVCLNPTQGWWSTGESSLSCVTYSFANEAYLGFHYDISDSERVTNGGFGTDSDWTKGTNWQITGGVANQTSPSASRLSQVLTSDMKRGMIYLLKFTVSNRTVGSLIAGIGEETITATTDGTYYGFILPTISFGTTATDVFDLRFLADGTWDGDLDDVSVTEAPYMLVDTSLENDKGHETLAYAKSGPLELDPGERRVMVDMVYPDNVSATGTSEIGGVAWYTFTTREYPTSTETTHGPYVPNNPLSVRFSGRQFTIKVGSPDPTVNHIDNGTFADDTGWTLSGAGWSITGGVLDGTGLGSADTATYTCDKPLIENMGYHVKYTISGRTQGGVTASLGGTNATRRTTDGTYIEVVTAGSTQDLVFTLDDLGGPFNGNIDDVEVYLYDFLETEQWRHHTARLNVKPLGKR